jgi:hypothetical protein
MADPSVDPARPSSEPPVTGPDVDELSEEALEAVVGGLTVEAALSRAGAFEAGRVPR